MCIQHFLSLNRLKGDMDTRIAIFSSASGSIAQATRELARRIGVYCAERNLCIVTGGSVGLPAEVVCSSRERGGLTEAFFPDGDEQKHNLNLHIHRNDSLKNYSVKHFYDGFSMRSAAMLKSVDGALVFHGGIGTLSEFCLAVEEGIKVAVIVGTGGVADRLPKIIKLTNREIPQDQILFGSDYKKAIDFLVVSRQ